MNFALYENRDRFGVTCHHMEPLVDSGAIINVRRFSILPTDGVESLLARTYDHQLSLFYEVMEPVLKGQELTYSIDKWSGPRRTSWRDVNELRRISPEMTQEEIARRVRATSFRDWQPEMELHGFRFRLHRNTETA